MYILDGVCVLERVMKPMIARKIIIYKSFVILFFL